jgi:hypothetical protein
LLCFRFELHGDVVGVNRFFWIAGFAAIGCKPATKAYRSPPLAATSHPTDWLERAKMARRALRVPVWPAALSVYQLCRLTKGGSGHACPLDQVTLGMCWMSDGGPLRVVCGRRLIDKSLVARAPRAATLPLRRRAA